MAKKPEVALLMGGSVSLASFNGGALAEVIRQLQRNLNQGVYSTVEIDVLYGASPSSMTLGLLLRQLMNPEGSSAEEVASRIRSSQFAAWIDQVDLRKLIPDRADPDKQSIPTVLDISAVLEIARGPLWQTENGRYPPRRPPLKEGSHLRAGGAQYLSKLAGTAG